MSKIKNMLFIIISIGIIGGIFYLKDLLLEQLFNNIEEENTVIIKEGNSYTKNQDFLFVQQEDDYIPNNFQDLLNIFYGIFNNGWVEFTFYCPTTYESCLDDVAEISNDLILLSDINNYVHPYNSYSSIRTVYDSSGQVTVYINKLYSLTEVQQLNSDIDNLMNSLLTDDMTIREKIKVMHDYIADMTTYDSERADKGTSDYDSARMTGTLYQHYALCSGYTDLMAVILNKLGVVNYKIASDSHIWNAVYLDNQWLHLDLTWDDPVSTIGKEVILDTFFLITTDELFSVDNKTSDHLFNKERYLEFS